MRLENEHLGNIDQYRVTREVPLPYSYDDHSHDSDGDEDDAGSHKSSAAGGTSWRMRRRRPSQVANAASGVEVDSGFVQD